MLVQGNKLAERFRSESFGQDRVRRPVALENTVGHEPIRRALGLDLLGRLAEGQRLGLRENVRHQHLVCRVQLEKKKLEKDQQRYEMQSIRTPEFLPVIAEYLPPPLRVKGKKSLDWRLKCCINGTAQTNLEHKKS